MNPTIKFLDDVKDRLENVDYSLIYQSVADMRDKFVPTALLHKHWYIDRVRINKTPDEIFTNEYDVSYIHDEKKINDYVTLGRANADKQAVFYGAVESPEIDMPRAVAYFETSELFRKPEIADNLTEVFTMSRWTILEDIEIMEIFHSEDALKESSYARASFNNQMSKIRDMPLAGEYEEQAKFFANQFARKDVSIGENHKYKISSAYANYIWQKTPFKGITYPSVQSNYKGQNVALLPVLVDKYLKLESVAMFKFERRNKVNLPIDCIKIATDFGKDNMNFTWEDYAR